MDVESLARASGNDSKGKLKVYVIKVFIHFLSLSLLDRSIQLVPWLYFGLLDADMDMFQPQVVNSEGNTRVAARGGPYFSKDWISSYSG